MLTLSYLTCWEIFDQSFWKLVTLYSSDSLEFDRKLEITLADIVITGFPARSLQKFSGSWVFHHVFIFAQWHNMTHQHRDTAQAPMCRAPGLRSINAGSGFRKGPVSNIYKCFKNYHCSVISFKGNWTILLCRPVRIFFQTDKITSQSIEETKVMMNVRFFSMTLIVAPMHGLLIDNGKLWQTEAGLK